MRKAKKSPWRYLFLTGAVISGGWLAFYGVLQLLALRSVDAAPASIGIIGGADGPTAIFVTTYVGANWDVAIIAVLLVVSIAGFVFFSRKEKKQ